MATCFCIHTCTRLSSSSSPSFCRKRIRLRYVYHRIIFIIIYTFPFFVQLSSSTLTTVWFHGSTFYYSCSTFRHSSFIPVIHHGSVANAGGGRNMRIGCISTIDINVIPYHSNRALLHSRLTSLRQIFQIIRR